MPLQVPSAPPVLGILIATFSIIPCACSSMAAEKWLFPLFSAAFVSVLFVLSAISGFTASAFFFRHRAPPDVFFGPALPPAFAYYISGGRGDQDRIVRLLLAVYHPRNRYLLHLSTEAPESERDSLADRARSVIPAIGAFGNVDVLGKPDAMTEMGSSVLAATLHAASIFLQLDGGWDWFVTLSAADYPLVTQDDLFHVFSSAPRDLNFIDHTSDLGWKQYHRVQPIIVDPAIYLARRNQIFYGSESRETPEAFKFFTGSPWVILSRAFIQFCIMGWDNLPRTLLLYFTNTVISQESYFHSVICNSPDFQNTSLNSDLRYTVWDNPPLMEPHFLNTTNYDDFISNGAPFARQFQKNDPVLDKIDEEILRRDRSQAVPGAWCTGRRGWMDPCSQWGDVNLVKPGSQAEKFGALMKKLLEKWSSKSSSCR